MKKIASIAWALTTTWLLTTSTACNAVVFDDKKPAHVAVMVLGYAQSCKLDIPESFLNTVAGDVGREFGKDYSGVLLESMMRADSNLEKQGPAGQKETCFQIFKALHAFDK